MKICRKITEWIEVEIQKPVERFFEKWEKFCEKLPWPLSWICHAVRTVVRVVELVIVRTMQAVIRIVCEIVTFTLNLIGWVLNTIFAIPIFGRWAQWVLGVGSWVVSQLLGAVDFIGNLIGVHPIKNVRLEVIILRDTDGTALTTEIALKQALTDASEILLDRASIKVTSNIQTASNPAPKFVLTVTTNTGLFLKDLTLAGGYFRLLTNVMLFDSAFFRALRFFDPVICFVVRGVGGSPEVGCSGGPVLDYLCVESSSVSPGPIYDSTVLAHEIGHALGLAHDSFLTGQQSGDNSNLMYANSSPTNLRGTNLSPFQVSIIRSSPHVSYL